ncbi:hypothetical protein SAMN04489844_1584 [Nocardioides exalbidus]|uniref:Uncharacterized protein n=1 Tax=Nocardioides exalbidus TaxID=402596 RepID=A0A1H4PDC0_9ACTN|nr:hypothetical protein SAMN04489844_1584 [Nocardioides exalbidus]
MVGEVVRDSWERELDVLLRDLEQADPTVGAELVQLVVAGLSIRRVLDPDLTHERAVALLEHAVSALG